ncbi:MAG: hypothetical protein QM784_39600 [Polyangiaceae bacterium]
MSNFTVSQNPSRYHIVGLKTQRYALPPSSGVAFAEGLLFGLPGGALLALPVALRSTANWDRAAFVWMGAAGLYGMLLGILAAAIRVARPLPRRSPALPLGLGFALGPLALLGTLLHGHTHHRPLGAATYAVMSGIVVALSWAFAARVLTNLRSPYPRRRTFGFVLAGVLTLVSLVCLSLPLLSWLRHFGAHKLLSSAIIDGSLGVAVALVGGFARFPVKLESAARTAGPLAFGVCALSLTVALQQVEIAPALARSSLLWAWLS